MIQKHILAYEDFINENQATLFGNMDEYIDRFKNVPGFTVGETLARVSGTPDEFPDIDSKGNWRTAGWNYSSLRSYTNNEFKSVKEVLDLYTKEVFGSNKKEWTATNLRKPSTLFDFNKKDRTVAFEKPGLGIIFLYCWDGSQDRHDKYTFQVKGMFMNTDQSWGAIDKFPEVKVQIDDIFTRKNIGKEELKAMNDYIKTRYIDGRGY